MVGGVRFLSPLHLPPTNKTLFPSGAGVSASKFEVVSFKSSVAGIEDGVVWWCFLGLLCGLLHGVPP